MRRSKKWWGLSTTAAAAAVLAAACTPGTTPPTSTTTTTAPPGFIGSSSEPSYVLGENGAIVQPIITTGDSVNNKPSGEPYRFVGIPDGTGAFDNGDGTFTVLVNHELGNTAGITRAHGNKGAFVSKWIVRKGTYEVLSGEDLIQQTALYDTVAGAWSAPASGALFSRFCSADLPPVSAFYDAASGTGTSERIFMNGEETGAEGRAFAHVVTGSSAGTSYELPWLGKFSWENSVANAGTGQATVVAGTDDTTPGQVYVYSGTKTTDANPVVAAGLTNGTLGGIAVSGLLTESDATTLAGPTPFTVPNLGDVSARTGAQLQADSVTAGITQFNRPEDATWDVNDPSVLYFVTTASFTGISRLWKMDFVDPAQPALGGTAEILLSGPSNDPAKTPAEQAGPRMMDNITATAGGDLLIQEDPGNSAYLAGIWQFDVATKKLRRVGVHAPAFFTQAPPTFITQDEETSGIIPLDVIGEPGKYLYVDQIHKASADPELVEGGQMGLLEVDDLN